MSAPESVSAKGIETTQEALVLVLEDRRVAVPWETCSEKLTAAREDERHRAELSPAGFGIHWPLIDEDLSVQGLIRAAEA